MRRLAVYASMCGAFLALGYPARAQDLSYKLRSNRVEGLKDLKRNSGGGLHLLSFVAWCEKVRLADSPVLRLRFFLERPRDVFITAVELRRHGRSHYQMRPSQKRWAAGWQEFGPWPAADVLVPAMIDPANVGVVARLDDDVDDGSGTIAPIFIYAHAPPGTAKHYVAEFMPDNTLSRVDYTVNNVDSGAVVVDKRMCADKPGAAKPCVSGNVPFELVLDLEGMAPGNYRLLIDTREFGHASGPSQEYFFHHRGGR